MTLLLFNKPYDVLSQFTDRGSPTKRATLSDFIQSPSLRKLSSISSFFSAGQPGWNAKVASCSGTSTWN